MGVLGQAIYKKASFIYLLLARASPGTIIKLRITMWVDAVLQARSHLFLLPLHIHIISLSHFTTLIHGYAF